MKKLLFYLKIDKKLLTDFCYFYIFITACNAACEYVLTDVLN